MLYQLKNKFLSWIDKELKARNKSLPVKHYCLMEKDVMLYSEAEVCNPRKKEDISIGENSHIRGRLLTFGHGGQIEIGQHCYIGHRSEIWSMETVKIGNRVLISHDVNINDSNCHSFSPTERHKHFTDIISKGHPVSSADLPGITSSPIIIEDDVWIGFGCTILRGVTIGKGSIISARSIVTKDVPAGSIYRNKISPIIEKLNTH